MSPIVRVEERLRARGEISPARRAGVIYRDDNAIPFLSDLENELKAILYYGDGATKTSFEITHDDHGMRWVILEDGKFPDLVSSVYTVGNAMGGNGARSNLLAAVFELYFSGTVDDNSFRTGTRTYWIYRYDRHAFYPFVPTGDDVGDRDRPTELALASRIRKEGMAVERRLEEWMGLWGIPI